jgi:hypothetical protein
LWQLRQPALNEAGDGIGVYYYGFTGKNVRLPIQDVGASDNLVFTINTSKFIPGDFDYEYQLISLDKLSEKLHLMSKFGPTAGSDPYFPHIEEDLDVDKVFGNIPFDTDWVASGYDNSPIIASGEFSGTTPVTVSTTLEFYDPEDDNYPNSANKKVMSDFILVIKPK